jgi:hypothetical protein
MKPMAVADFQGFSTAGWSLERFLIILWVAEITAARYASD